ncbi:hypothetical protein NQZ68_012859 [Dissostichus eleginoides]|nr:hypothetical protein NQZ68_012859 [Dissostichus eleginoides]
MPGSAGLGRRERRKRQTRRKTKTRRKKGRRTRKGRKERRKDPLKTSAMRMKDRVMVGGEDGAKRSAKQSSGGTEGSSRGAEGSGSGGKKCRSPGVVEDISEASEMEEGELEEGPVDTKVFGSPNDEPRGRGMRRNRSEEKKTSSENAGLTARRKADKERETEKRRVSSTEGELGKDTGLR